MYISQRCRCPKKARGVPIWTCQLQKLFSYIPYLNRGTRDVEPLVNAGIDRSIRFRRSSRHIGSGGVGVLESSVLDGNAVVVVRSALKRFPGLVALANNVLGVLSVLALTAEGELVLRLAIRDLVDAEPLVSSTQKTREVTLNILNVVDLGSVGVLDINSDDLPVSLTLVEEGHDTQDLDLLDLASVANSLTDLANVERIVVTNGLSFRMGVVRVLPSLRERTVVVNITLVGEAVTHKTELALLGVLNDGVELLLLGNLELSVSPAGNFNHHVQNGLLGVRVQGNIMERRHNLAGVVLDVNLVLWSVFSADLTNVVSHSKMSVDETQTLHL